MAGKTSSPKTAKNCKFLDDRRSSAAVLEALTYPTAAYREGYVPPSAINWNDADDNNAFHSKQTIMDLDGSLSTEVAIIADKEAYNDIVTYGLALSNAGKPVPSMAGSFCGLIPKGAKNVAVAKDFLKYLIQPDVLNEYLKTGLGRREPPDAVDREEGSVVVRPQRPAPGCLYDAGRAEPNPAAVLGSTRPGRRSRASMSGRRRGPKSCEGRDRTWRGRAEGRPSGPRRSSRNIRSSRAEEGRPARFSIILNRHSRESRNTGPSNVWLAWAAACAEVTI